jgi:hypothetical protein
MTFLEFADRQLGRLSFRVSVGWFSLITGVGGVLAVSFWAVPQANAAFVFGSIGTLVGWGGAVVASQFGDRSRRAPPANGDER